MEEGAAPKPRSDWPLAVLAAVLVVGSGVGAYLYHVRQNGETPTDATGFDLAQTENKSRTYAPLAAGSPQTRSSLNMITGAIPGMSVGSGANRAAAPAPASTFTQICRSAEAATRRMAEDYTRRFPVIRQYGRDWMSYPDLKKLNDDYMRDHDPVKFLHGLAVSPSFPLLVKKYATRPEIQGFAKDAVTRAPQGLMASGMDLVSQDGSLKRLMDGVVGALGLPPGLFGGEPGKVDERAVMDSVLKSNPELQKAVGQ